MFVCYVYTYTHMYTPIRIDVIYYCVFNVFVYNSTYTFCILGNDQFLVQIPRTYIEVD